jgi:pimeloyl-ACP methyl ester carboxylesterase
MSSASANAPTVGSAGGADPNKATGSSDGDPINPQFTTVDGLRIRYATSPRPGAETVVLLSPWPESIYAYLPMWKALAEQFSLVAFDLPGFGQSEGRADLMSTRAMGEFVVRLIATLDIERPHAVGPDIGTGALLWAAVAHPDAFRSLVIGAGAATFPLQVDGLLKTFIDAGSIAPFKELNPADVISQSVGSMKNYDVPAIVREDYTKAYSGDRFAQSVAYVQSYPSDLEALAPKLPSLTTSVQILVGRDDPYGLAADAQRLDQQLGHSRMHVFSTGHNAWEEAPGPYATAIVDWVNGGYADV